MPAHKKKEERIETTASPINPKGQKKEYIEIPLPKFNLRGTSINTILVILLVIAAFIIGSLVTKVQYLEKNASQAEGTVSAAGTVTNAPTAPARPTKLDVGIGKLPLLGDANAKVTIVEFSDFQCPFCRKFYNEALQQIKKDYIDTGKVKLAYRHFPLSFHPMSMPSALASECANEQGRFWDYHDKMFEEQEKLGQGTVQYTSDDLKTWAQNIGLNTTQFNTCLDSEKYKDKVQKDISEATAAGVNSTPTFSINGEIVEGAQPFNAFKTAIDRALK
ncbi:MAG: DsbA family protein [Candidatus Levybacteria bacterium]|nr:DsbA family protein [Candidatus Levybacteria bacterium]